MLAFCPLFALISFKKKYAYPFLTSEHFVCIFAVNSWGKRIVSIKITADRRIESSPAADVSSVDSHAMTTSSVEMATCALAAALYVLNKCPIHSRYVRRGIGRRQLFDAGQFLVNEFEEVHVHVKPVLGIGLLEANMPWSKATMNSF